MDGKLHKLAMYFLSRTLRGAEMRYLATQLEGLSVVVGFRKTPLLSGCKYV